MNQFLRWLHLILGSSACKQLLPIILFTFHKSTENKLNFSYTYDPFTQFHSTILFSSDCALNFSKISVIVIKDIVIFENEWFYIYLLFSFKQCVTKHTGSSIIPCQSYTNTIWISNSEPSHLKTVIHIYVRWKPNFCSPIFNHLKPLHIYKLHSLLELKKFF